MMVLLLIIYVFLLVNVPSWSIIIIFSEKGTLFGKVM